MIKKGIQFLFARRVQEGKWVYVLGALPLLLFALMGWEYNAAFLYLPLAILCIIQCFFPTMITWIILFVLFSLAAATYIHVFTKDLLDLLGGAKSGVSMFANPDDALFFTILTGLFLIIAIGLYKIRPKKYVI